MALETAVRSLCNCMKNLGFLNVHPEVIRQAKQGTSDPAVLEILHKALADIHNTVNFDLISRTPVFPCTSHSPNILVLIFYFIRKYKILDQLAFELQCYPFFQENVLQDLILPQNITPKVIHYEGNPEPTALKFDVCMVDKIKCIIRKTRLALCSQSTDCSRVAILSHKIQVDIAKNSCFNKCSINPDLQAFTIIKQLEAKCNMLRTFSKWKETENIFWSWLLTIPNQEICLGLCKNSIAVEMNLNYLEDPEPPCRNLNNLVLHKQLFYSGTAPSLENTLSISDINIMLQTRCEYLRKLLQELEKQ